MIREKTISADLKRYRVYWIVMLILFTIFAVVIVKTVQKSNEEELAEIALSNKAAVKREIEAKLARDSAKVQLNVTNNKLLQLEKNLLNTNNTLLRMENSFSNSYEQLIKFKLNEKEFINPNASPTEQSTYISSYRYKEF